MLLILVDAGSMVVSTLNICLGKPPLKMLWINDNIARLMLAAESTS